MTKQVTPETLTDEMVREFYDELDPAVEGEGVLRLHCSTALMPENAMSAHVFPLARNGARRRVCDAIRGWQVSRAVRARKEML